MTVHEPIDGHHPIAPGGAHMQAPTDQFDASTYIQHFKALRDMANVNVIDAHNHLTAAAEAVVQLEADGQIRTDADKHAMTHMLAAAAGEATARALVACAASLSLIADRAHHSLLASVIDPQ